MSRLHWFLLKGASLEVGFCMCSKKEREEDVEGEEMLSL